jgi:hypothetical protein
MSASSSASKCPDIARNNGARCLRLIDTLIGDAAGSHRYSMTAAAPASPGVEGKMSPRALIGAVALSEICVRVRPRKRVWQRVKRGEIEAIMLGANTRKACGSS